jgi:hypothetical protein
LSSSPRAGVDFFAQGGLPVPQVTILQAERVAASGADFFADALDRVLTEGW